MRSIPDLYAELPIPVRRPLWQLWHKIMIRYDKDVTANYMNYGYQGLNGDPVLHLMEADEPDRYCIQLYDHVVNRVELQDREVLEVGSGRGGGASYISRYYRPKSYTGLDISSSIVNFCNQHYEVKGLSFRKGVAENLPFENESFDAIVNVESARCYKSLSSFFNEVYRVLRQGGKFLFTDMIRPHHLEEVRSGLKTSGLKTVHESEITPNVVEALNRDSKRRKRLIREKVPSFLVKPFDTFAGAKGTERYNSFANGTFEYWSFVLEK